jgi:hypothetical protein
MNTITNLDDFINDLKQYKEYTVALKCGSIDGVIVCDSFKVTKGGTFEFYNKKHPYDNTFYFMDIPNHIDKTTLPDNFKKYTEKATYSVYMGNSNERNVVWAYK